MRKFLLIISTFFGAVLSTVIFATELKIYENPVETAKVIAKMKIGEQLMPIIYTQKRDWVKVANPINGDVGWAKVDELKGPLIVTKINGTETHHQVIVDKDNKGKQPQVYSIIQYSGPQELKPEDAQKMVKEMERRNKEMEKSMQKMREHMQKNMLEMFKDFDKSFTFPIIQPIIVVPDNSGVDKTKK